MIIFEDVYKRYIINHVPGQWVLQGASFVIPHKACVGVIGSKGAGKTTLLRLIDGTEMPTGGKIERNGRIATPMRYNKNFQPLLSGRQNAKFICRINGYADEMEERLLRIEKLAMLGAKFDEPVGTYPPTMKSRLSFALSMAFNFDMYISDCFNFSGEIAFKDKGIADVALKNLTEHAGIIMTTQGVQGAAVLKRYCKSGIWLHEGKAKWFDDINDAFEAHKASQPPVPLKGSKNQQAQPVPEQMQPIAIKIKQLQNTLTILNKALNGHPINTLEKKIPWLIQVARNVGMELATTEQISDRGYQLREGMIPILQGSGTGGHLIEYYDLKTQCDKIQPP